LDPGSVSYLPSGACAVSGGGSFVALLQSKKCTVYDAKTLSSVYAFRGAFAFGEYGLSEDRVEFASDGTGIVISREEFGEPTDSVGHR
jgi:hypothetical protein